MSCEAINPELVGFHFGTLDLERRREVEAHLVACASCLRDYLAVKAQLESAERSEVRASAGARTRLRQAVAEELGLSTPRVWWHRPAAFGFASLAATLAVVAVRVLSVSGGAMPLGLTP